MANIDYDKLSNTQLTGLMQQARAESRRQREQRDALKTAQIEAEWANKVEALGADTQQQQLNDEPVLGGWDESMLVQEHQGKRMTMLERIAEFANNNLQDSEIARLLPPDEHAFTVNCDDFLMLGEYERGEWKVRATDEVSDRPDIKFRLPGSLDRDQAISNAANYVREQVGPQFRELSEADRNLIQRMAVSDRNAAMLAYLKARLPIEWAEELGRLVAQSEIRGDVSKVLEYASQPEIHPALEEAIAATWGFNRPHLEITPEMQEFFQQRTEGVALTFPLLDALLKQFQIGTSLSHTETPAPTREDLDSLSDQEAADLYQRSRLEFARTRQ